MIFAPAARPIVERRTGPNRRLGGGRAWWRAGSMALVIAARSSSVLALDKQGSAHGGSVAGAAEGTSVSGSVMLGSALYNPTYAARPDNSGHALFRYAARTDIDIIGSRLSIPIDVNLFTDRDQPGLSVMRPTELDIIGGVTSTWPLGRGALEVGTRVEHDRPVDQGTFTQTYIDIRARYLYSLAGLWPDLASRGTEVSGWVTLGAFVVNPTYAARPDNTGKALFRYALHTELSVMDDLFSFGIDGTLFTDRTSAVVVPSEVDITPEFIVHLAPFELHLAYESDVPIDRSGLTQTYVYLLGVWSFDFQKDTAPPARRGQIPSP